MADRDVADVDRGRSREQGAEEAPSREDSVAADQRELYERKQAVAKAVEDRGGKVYATGVHEGQDFVVLEGDDGGPGEAFYVNGGRTKKANLGEIFVSSADEEEGEDQ